MAWKGFITESKLFMDYPGYIRGRGLNPWIHGWQLFSDKQERQVRQFWFGFFFWAAPRFYWYCFRDYLHGLWLRLTA